MSILKQVQSIKIHPSGWPFVALLCIGGFVVGSILEAPILFMVGSIALGIFIFLDQNFKGKHTNYAVSRVEWPSLIFLFFFCNR